MSFCENRMFMAMYHQDLPIITRDSELAGATLLCDNHNQHRGSLRVLLKNEIMQAFVHFFNITEQDVLRGNYFQTLSV